MIQVRRADTEHEPLNRSFESDNELPISTASVPESERMIRLAFAEDADAGISMLFRYYYQPLCSHAVRVVSSKEVAEDIVSDIFYEFHAGQLYLTIITSYRAFFYTAVRNRAFDYMRVAINRNASLDKADQTPLRTDQQPDSLVQYDELCHDVELAINALSQKRRQVYLMHRYDGKKYREIAQELNLSAKTVEVHMANAIQQIRQRLNDKWYLR